MAIEPISLQLGNYGVEHLAQTSKSSLAQAQQTSQMSELIKENVKKAQEIQPSDQLVASERVHRKTDDEHREERKQGQEQKKNAAGNGGDEDENTAAPGQKSGGYDFYV